MTKKMGRPTKYTTEFINKMTDTLYKYIAKTKIPFIKEFAYKNKIPSEEISRTLAAKNENFSHALKILKDKQEIALVQAGLQNKLNPTVCIFTLKNVAGWRDTPSVLIDQSKNIKVTIFRNAKSEAEYERAKRGIKTTSKLSTR